MKISIIGSFRKHYNEICLLIDCLQKAGHNILSPANSEIVNSIEDFVIFRSDNKAYSPAQIQTETLNKILKSDIVYVYCPDGYVGRTTCYEIGILRATVVPIIFSCIPKDLPIYVSKENIVPHDVFPFFLNNIFNDVSRKNISHQLDISKTKFPLKKIVICGSMMFYPEMEKISKVLEKENIPTVIPKEENDCIQNLSAHDFSAFKRKVSMQYLSKIRENTCFGILVINNLKNDRENYIGTNTLVEISMAFCWGRPVFLYNSYYQPMKDELVAWNAVCLNRNLSKLIEIYNDNRYSFDVENKNEQKDIISGQLFMEF